MRFQRRLGRIGRVIHCNRIVRIHKMVCEALQRPCWKAFEETLPEDHHDLQTVMAAVLKLRNNVLKGQM